MPDIAVRRADPDELGRIIDLATDALGWDPSAPNEDFFRWKHLENPFGPSPMWVAEIDGRLAGFRTFLRWRFIGQPGETFQAVRAVDTATVAEFRGRGVFSALTRHAVDEVTDEGVDFVFNTPNDQSRPGYIKMGWVDAGRVAIGMRPTLRGIPRIAGARAAADKWGLPDTRGTTIEAALEDIPDDAGVGPTDGIRLRTPRTAGFLRWRYGFAPLHYRVLGDARGALLIARRRRRGSATELTVCDLIPSGHGAQESRRLLRSLHGRNADYAVASSATAGPGLGFLPVPRLGPRLTLRDLASESPDPADLALTLGDVELF